MSEEESCSDHKHIRFEISGIQRTVETYLDPRNANWEAFGADLTSKLTSIKSMVRNATEVELVAEQLTDAIRSSFEENCPQTVRSHKRATPWWTVQLEARRRQVRKNWNRAKRSGDWGEYKTSLTEYNKELKRAKRLSWRRYCEGIDSTSECARLQKILSKDSQSSINSLVTSAGEYTSTGKETLTELFRVHFPRSIALEQSPETWKSSGLENFTRRASREDWQVSKRVIDQSKIKWAISSFEPYKSPGPDGICPIMLQKGPDLLTSKLCTLLRASLALGYIPRIWRLTRVAFIPKMFPVRDQGRVRKVYA